jgi:hypothetical protein
MSACLAGLATISLKTERSKVYPQKSETLTPKLS